MMELLSHLSTVEILVGLLVAGGVWIVAFILLVRPYPRREEAPLSSVDRVNPPLRDVGRTGNAETGRSLQTASGGRAFERPPPERIPRIPSGEVIERTLAPWPGGGSKEVPGSSTAPAGNPTWGTSGGSSEEEMKELKAKLDEALKIIRQSGL